MRKHKPVKVVLVQCDGSLTGEAFEVKKLVNTIEFSVGELIDIDYVRDLIKDKNITVEIVSK